MDRERSKIPIIIIAGGQSSRLGRPKQLERRPDNNLLLIQHAIQEAIDSELGEVIVVLGAYANRIKKEIKKYDCTILENPDWILGQSTSIKTGVKHILHKNISACIISVVDQIFLDKKYFIELFDKYNRTESTIIYSKYSSAKGPPVLFDNSLFNDLQSLNGDKGALSILNKKNSKISYILFEKGHLDVDTEKDIEKLQKLNLKKN